ncbi:hypothetical protein RFI_09414, partial [Reticulomyxa filosa]
ALKDRSELLIRERDDVKKQKEQWQHLVDEQKQRAEMFRKQQEDLDKRHQEVLDLHRSVTEERKKLHDEKKRFINERHKWEKEKNKLWKRDSGSIQELAAKQKAFTNVSSSPSSSSSVNPNSNPMAPSLKPVSGLSKHRRSGSTNLQYDTLFMMGGSLKDARAMATSLGTVGSIPETGSEYPESEYADTIISDTITDLESLNSISDEEAEKDGHFNHKNKHHSLNLSISEYE